MQMITRISSFVFVAIVILFTAGCYDKKIDGQTITMVFSSWVPRVTLGVSLGLIVVGLMLRKRSMVNLYTFGGLGLFGLLVILPATTFDSVIIDDDHYERNGGFSFFRHKEEIKFKDVDSIQLISRMERGRRGREKQNFYLEVYDKGSIEPRELPVGDMVKSMLEDIANKAHARGVKFIIAPNLELP